MNLEEQPQENKVKDKRRLNPDGSLKEGVAEETPAEELKHETTASEAKKDTAAGENQTDEQAAMPPPNIFATMEFLIGLLAEQAWMLMGIRLAPGQKEAVKDLTQAKAAIDTIVFMVDKLHPHIEEQDRIALRDLISDLQINFVRQNQ